MLRYMSNKGAPWARARLAVVIGAVCAAMALTACGSSNKSANSGSASSGTSSTSGGAGQTLTLPTGVVKLDQTYAPGVPTLADLYKGTEAPPPADGPRAAKGKTVIIVSCGQAVPACSNVARAMTDAFTTLGWTSRIIDGQLNANGGWDTAVRQAIAAHPDAIVNALGMNCSDIKQPLEEAKAARVPFFGVGSIDCNDPQNPGGPSAPLLAGNLQFNRGAPGVSALYLQIGQQQAAAAIDATQGKAQIIRTQYLSGFGVYQAQGQDEVLKKCAGCKVLASIRWVAADSSPGGLLEQRFQTTLSRYPTANTVIYNFDSTATSAGLAKALVDSGRAKSMTGVASEGYATGLTLMRNHAGIDLVPAYSGTWIGWGTADMVNRYFNRAPNVPEGIGVRLVDREHNLPASGEYTTPIDFKADYKKVWLGK